MSRILGWLLWCCLVMSLGAQPPAELRVWEFAEGRQMTLRLVNAYGDRAWFVNAEGGNVAFPIRLLTEGDQADVVAWARRRDAEYLAGTDPLTDFSAQFREDARRLEGKKLVEPDWTGQAEPEFYAIYFSARWCGPCRRFTPGFVVGYQGLKAAFPNAFEVLFVSSDESQSEMIKYMTEDAMPWYATWKEREAKTWRKYSGNGIPCLVIVDREGNVLAHSYDGRGEYLGPQAPLDMLTRLLWTTETASGSRCTVPPPAIDPAKLNRLLNTRKSQAKLKGERLKPVIVSAPMQILAPLVDPALPEVAVQVEVSLNARGIVEKIALPPGYPAELRERLERASLLWQFAPGVDPDGEAKPALVRFDLTLRLRPEYAPPPAVVAMAE